MKIEELPKWMHAIPVLIGVALAIIGIQFWPAMGIRGTIGPIVELPVGVIIGFVILAIYAKSKGDWLQYSPVRARTDNDWIRIKKEKWWKMRILLNRLLTVYWKYGGVIYGDFTICLMKVSDDFRVGYIFNDLIPLALWIDSPGWSSTRKLSISYGLKIYRACKGSRRN